MIIIIVAACVAFVLPAFIVLRPPIRGGVVQAVLCVALAAAGFWLGTRLRSRVTAICGAISALGLAWLLTQATYPGAVDVLALPFASSLGFAAAAFSPEIGPFRPGRPASPLLVSGATLGIAVVALFATFWTGSTNPRARWFGSLQSHGDRSVPTVAITFDDGPNPDYTLEVARILDEYGAKGTFFEVGKAVAQRPDITKALLADGQVVGNHSYLHDAVRYLDPGYPELERAERAIARETGVCPALFRPPHGTHTPFMSHIVDDRGMTLVTWDVSAQDWVEDDPGRLAANILAKVKPGSIILLHDGLDGNIPADRSVVVKALPAILDGLAAKGLRPVTLPELLHVPAYLPDAKCAQYAADGS